MGLRPRRRPAFLTGSGDPGTPERLLLRLRPDLPRRLSAREHRVEVVGAYLFGFCAVAMALALESPRHPSLAAVGGLVLMHAACSRIRIYIGGGYAMPTEIVLVTMLFWLPAGWVPLAVAAGLVLAALVDVARGTAHPERITTGINDAWHAVGPAVVMAIAGQPEPTTAEWALLIPLLLSQFVFDAGISTLREWLGRALKPGLQIKVMAWVCSIDALLAPLGLLAAIASSETPGAWLLAGPPALLVAILAVDRRRRMEKEYSRVHELRRERERLQEVLRRVGRAFATDLDRDALIQAVADTAAEALAAQVSWVAGARQNDPAPATLLSDDGHVIDRALRAAVLAARHGGGVATGRVGEWHAIACPLRDRAILPETLAVARRHPFTTDDQELLSHLTEHAGVSLQNAELHERLRVQAMVDELTGLANHRHLQDFMSDAIERAASDHQEIGLIMFDLDDFKAINDTYGHQQGDTVLRLVGRAIRDSCRPGDEAARYGGEELAICLPGAGQEESFALAERVRATIAELRFPLHEGEWHDVTLSAGVACFPANATTKSALIAAADDALYAAKRTGKNRTVVAPRVLSTSEP